MAFNRSPGNAVYSGSFAQICKCLVLHVVALKDKLVAKWEGIGLSFRQYVYTSCFVVLFFNNKVIHLRLNTK